MPGYHDLVDFHGPIRNRALAAFRLVPGWETLTDHELLNAAWPIWQLLVADLLEASDCPNCVGVGLLEGRATGEIICPVCDGDGSVYGADLAPLVKPVRDPSLPPPSTSNTGGVPRPARPDPGEVDAADLPTRGVLPGTPGQPPAGPRSSGR